MKLMFASDIHGSELWCRKMLEAYEREKPQKLCLLGDILYHGPRNDLPDGYAPKAVIELLNPHRNALLCVRGNCDTEVDQMVLKFPLMQESALIFADGREFFLSHGHHINPQNTANLSVGAVLLNGHTHVPKAETVNGVFCLNCGSVAIPKENSPHSYLIYEDGIFVWKDLESGAAYKRFEL